MILSERATYEQLYDFYQDLSKELLKENKFKVLQSNFKNNTDIKQKIQVLQRLQKYSVEKTI